MVMINLPTAGVDYHVPFGGRAARPMARASRAFAVEFFTQIKTGLHRWP